MHVYHKLEDYNTVLAYYSKFKYRLKVTKNSAKSKPDRKLVLRKVTKAVLLTIGIFTKEQADKSIKETQANLLKDF